MNRINDWALAVKIHEGWITPADKNPKYPLGSPSFRNNNPGNLRCYPLVMGELGAIACKNNLAVFPDYITGFKALTTFLTYACTNQLRDYKLSMTLLQFYEKYAPSSDHNNPLNYASFIAKNLGVTVDTKIGDLYSIGDTIDNPIIKNSMMTFCYNQNNYPKNTLGFSKLTIKSDGCKLCSITSVYQFLTGIIITPPQMNEKLKAGGAFSGALLDDTKVAKVLGWNFIGKFTDINKTPESMSVLNPTLKEVDYSYRPGNQQHFVVRVHDDSGNYILDPIGGVKRKINYYENLVHNLDWKRGGFSYRVFKS